MSEQDRKDLLLALIDKPTIYVNVEIAEDPELWKWVQNELKLSYGENALEYVEFVGPKHRIQQFDSGFPFA